MFLYAPYPTLEAVILLPEPQLLNEETSQDVRDYKISMDKTVHSYVKTTTERIYNYRFSVTREKAVELYEFLKEYVDSEWRVVDHHGVVFIGYVNNNPNVFEFFGVNNGQCSLFDYSLNERSTIDLEFVA